jgi:hypothetical protein
MFDYQRLSKKHMEKNWCAAQFILVSVDQAHLNTHVGWWNSHSIPMSGQTHDLRKSLLVTPLCFVGYIHTHVLWVILSYSPEGPKKCHILSENHLEIYPIGQCNIRISILDGFAVPVGRGQTSYVYHTHYISWKLSITSMYVCMYVCR